MTITNLILNISERYITPKDPEDKQRQEDLLRNDFGFYGEQKLEKVWYAIKRYHRANFAPNYSAIVDCMDKAGLGESHANVSNWYQQCNKCGCKYSMGVCACPKCNRRLDNGVIEKSDVTIVKCDDLPQDVITLRQACPICPIFRGNAAYPKGIKCNDYQGEMRGQLPECEKCNCRLCCLDLGSKNEGMDSGTLIGVVNGLVESKRS